jgi:hypothetical protein
MAVILSRKAEWLSDDARCAVRVLYPVGPRPETRTIIVSPRVSRLF